MNSPHCAQDAKISIQNHIPKTPLQLHDRFTRFSNITETNIQISHDDSIIIHHCLDTIERLIDPRTRLTEEVTKCRPRKTGRTDVKIIATDSMSDSTRNDCTSSTEEEIHSRLTELLKEVEVLNVEMDQRRKESTQIYDMFNGRCELLERRLRDRETEVEALRGDILDDTIEMEGLRGTVHGLESWVDDWQRQHYLTLAREMNDHSKRRRTMRRPMGQSDYDERLLEGIMAWIRGWKDVEEGFRGREHERQLRREERGNLRMNVDYESLSLPQL